MFVETVAHFSKKVLWNKKEFKDTETLFRSSIPAYLQTNASVENVIEEIRPHRCLFHSSLFRTSNYPFTSTSPKSQHS